MGANPTANIHPLKRTFFAPFLATFGMRVVTARMRCAHAPCLSTESGELQHEITEGAERHGGQHFLGVFTIRERVKVICKDSFCARTGWCAASYDVGYFSAHPFFKLDDAVRDKANSENIEP
jgi:hypothetical protein